MDLPKIKKGIYAELPSITETVKQGAIVKAAGLRPSFISDKLNHTNDGRGYAAKFSLSDVQKVNEGLWKLGEQLVNLQIGFSEDHNTMRLIVKEALNALFLKVFLIRVLKMEEYAVRSLMYRVEVKRQRGRFTPEMVEKLTLAAREVGVRLLSTELYLDEG